MFFGFDLKELFYFPFKDADARKQLLIGALISLTAFIIPLLPFFVLTGYAIQMAKQVLNNESPRMVPWDNWGDLFKDGAKVLGIRIVYSLPILILVLPLMISSFILPVASSSSGSTPEMDPLFLVFIGVFSITMCLIIPVSIAAAVFIPAAEMHTIATDEFSAGFRFKEWWAIFRANMGGFLAAFGIYYLASMALAILVQILMVTVILACLLPIILPGTTIYIMIIMYVSIAQAYRDGKAKLAQKEAVPAAQ